MKKITAAFLITALFGSVGSAQAGTISFTDSISLTRTNWMTGMSFAKFDTSLGALTSIVFNLKGTVEGIGRAESEDNAASTVTLNLGSLLTLTRPDRSTLVVANPVFTRIFDFTAFDGDVDYAGTSGGSTGRQSSTASESFASRSHADFNLFSGPGSIMLNLKAVGASSAEGAGNLDTKFQTFASGSGTVTYNYTDSAIPEPASLGIMGLGLGILALTRRRRAVKAA